MFNMQAWRFLLATWLLVSGILWITGPSFSSALAIEGLLAIVTAVFLLISVKERTV